MGQAPDDKRKTDQSMSGRNSSQATTNERSPAAAAALRVTDSIAGQWSAGTLFERHWWITPWDFNPISEASRVMPPTADIALSSARARGSLLSSMPRIVVSFTDNASTSNRGFPYPSAVNIHEEIRRRRKEKKISQQELADRIGVARSAVAQWEAGATAPSRRHMEAVAEALGASIAELVSTANGALVTTAITIPVHIEWDRVMRGPLPVSFTVEMPDEALRTTTPKGTKLLCSTAAQPGYGKGVIVRAPDGRAHVRRYTQSAHGGWDAVADVPGFATLHSASGATILACVIGRLDGTV
jgi:DNA-binding XRE family transcriptional regulator